MQPDFARASREDLLEDIAEIQRVQKKCERRLHELTAYASITLDRDVSTLVNRINTCKLETVIVRSSIKCLATETEIGLLDMPTEVFAHIAGYCDIQARAVCRAFRKYTPLVCINLTPATISDILQYVRPSGHLHDKLPLYRGPLHLNIRSSSPAAMYVAQMLLQGRRGYVNFYKGVQQPLGEIAPRSVMLRRDQPVGISTANLRIVKFTHMDYVVDMLPALPKLQFVQYLGKKRIIPHYEPTLIRTHRPVVMSAHTFKYITRCRIYFEKLPALHSLTTKQYKSIVRLFSGYYGAQYCGLLGTRQLHLQFRVVDTLEPIQTCLLKLGPE